MTPQALSVPLSVPAFPAPRLSRRWALGAIAAAHLALFHVVSQGMLHTAAAPAEPREIEISLLAAPLPAKTPAPPKSPSEVLKVQPVLTVPPVQAPAPEIVTAAETPAPAVPARSTPAVAPTAEPAAAPAPVAIRAAGPRAVTSGIEYVRAPQPVYPAMSRRLGEQGAVMLRVLVSDQGRPERIDIVQSSGSARLDEAARQAVQRAQFKPHREDGMPVAMYAMVPITFEAER